MTFNINNFAQYQGVKDYSTAMEKLRWMRSLEGMITLQQEMIAYIDVGLPEIKRESLGWYSLANVYKSKKGNRYIVEIQGVPKVYAFHTLREAMRMAKFLHKMKSNL